MRLMAASISATWWVDDGDYPGIDDEWREMSESERREHLRLGGRIAEWLKSMEQKGSQ